MTVVNLEAGMPTVATAQSLLSQSLRTAKANGTRLVKLIHGYGSTGKGGAIRGAVRRELADRKRRGQQLPARCPATVLPLPCLPLRCCP